MDIDVKRISGGKYAEVEIKDGDDVIQSGLLDAEQRMELARLLISAAHDLLYAK